MKNNLGFLGLGLINRQGLLIRGDMPFFYCKNGSGAPGLLNREGFTNTMYTLCLLKVVCYVIGPRHDFIERATSYWRRCDGPRDLQTEVWDTGCGILGDAQNQGPDGIYAGSGTRFPRTE